MGAGSAGNFRGVGGAFHDSPESRVTVLSVMHTVVFIDQRGQGNSGESDLRGGEAGGARWRMTGCSESFLYATTRKTAAFGRALEEVKKAY